MDSLIPTYRAMAETETGNFQGLSIVNHVASIRKLIDATGSTTLLDFGCGRGDAYRDPHKIHHELGISFSRMHLYDPAFRHSRALPVGQFDIVVCSDVLEHIPEFEVDPFVARLFGYARKAVWASVCSRPAKKVFPGTDTNLHVTIKPLEWWQAKFEEHRLPPVKWALVGTP